MSRRHFTLRQLDIFAAVMQTGQVRRAAATCHIGQAAVSQALRELADTLGVTLFVSRGRLLEPTSNAHRLLALASGPRAELSALAERLRGEPDAAFVGPVHLAASSTIARYLLPALLADLVARHPALRPTLSSGNSVETEARVAAGAADIGFIEGPTTRADILACHWRTDRLTLIGPPSAPATLAGADLAHWPWVAREAGSGTRTVFEHDLALAGITIPPATLVVDDSGAQVRAVAAGAGLACVSRAAAAAAAAAGDIRLVTLAGQDFARPLWSIRRAGADPEPLANRLLAALASPSA
ncbi:LysR family transcriptional regulator [Salinisphaera sp. Q1T1-3]|uniref:LysR family transcriptional regulator n=1 Tax=Salinisphaera sp. Q1T1-3 TaxID=2321229 RepID=UPI000E72EE93|nr:LysR family transcriptional regulator [Salinisphaera sp. Q1T1-3]RJS91950.1 LysR family transcriptional regulator [Salinisphaera sp. Q1T1-3]